MYKVKNQRMSVTFVLFFAGSSTKSYCFSLGRSLDLYFCVALVKTEYNARSAVQQFCQNIVCRVQYVNKSEIHIIPKVLQHHISTLQKKISICSRHQPSLPRVMFPQQ